MAQTDTSPDTNQQKPWRKRTLFISGRLSLDFAHTGGPGPYQKFERLHTPVDLSLWFALSELSLEATTVTPADLQKAHELRWAIWQTANALRERKLPEVHDIQIINKAATTPPLTPMLDGTTSKQLWQRPATARAALSTIARNAIEVFTHQDHAPIQQCAGSNCALLFVDNSRSGKRKWCAMERCGNMAKVAKYRKDKR